MSPSRIRMVCPSRGGAPVPSITRALVSAMTAASVVMNGRTVLLKSGR
jgi:hypothetical protein